MPTIQQYEVLESCLSSHCPNGWNHAATTESLDVGCVHAFPRSIQLTKFTRNKVTRSTFSRNEYLQMPGCTRYLENETKRRCCFSTIGLDCSGTFPPETVSPLSPDAGIHSKVVELFIRLRMSLTRSSDLTGLDYYWTINGRHASHDHGSTNTV